ncbi:hypothetical protein SARC_07940 [Sphaeroforma arctica JP610]|uniref:Uncharacterized protein n=1 Tax=Sphaeroforma arctica JP610 TaxID=667725 RepID=A0A0L0FSX9_9EUKA|nr:hypothetical protein SARC_07940 [Sphaeroforma arctica JP610]KNC79676.1 hypothetical protein SARC_07940 [Sphaeroforma arctica JP610]|eukprot:XP_014153578.1 hypothetical protein SARC_07940 [Sphaeroforma arctica JP610]
MWPGSAAMGDKEFHIADLLPAGCTYNVPPMLRKDNQFTIAQNLETIEIASSAKLFRMLAQEYITHSEEGSRVINRT